MPVAQARRFVDMGPQMHPRRGPRNRPADVEIAGRGIDGVAVDDHKAVDAIRLQVVDQSGQIAVPGSGEACKRQRLDGSPVAPSASFSAIART